MRIRLEIPVVEYASCFLFFHAVLHAKSDDYACDTAIWAFHTGVC